MYPASEFQYKGLHDVRYLGPPHQRFPHMHPEKQLWPVENQVYLEMELLCLGMRIFWSAMAGVTFLGVLMLIITGLITGGPIIGWFFLEIIGIVLLFSFFTLLTNPEEHMPIRLYRPTQELIYCVKGQIYRVPWAQMPVRIIKSFQMRPAYSTYTLQFGLGKDPNQPMDYIHAGGGERYEEEALRDWEYYCRYMESGRVELRKTPEKEKTASRKIWEDSDESPFIKITGLIVVPIGWVIATLGNKSFFKHKHEHVWPQEVIDMCENHPFLKQNGPTG